MNKQDVLILLFLFVIWRVSLFLTGAVADSFLEYDPSFPYAFTLLPEYGLPRWLYSWANFDGIHYLTIATKGYIGTGLVQAFFPVYPYLVAGIEFLLNNYLLAGLLLANVSAFGVLLLLFYLGKLYFTKEIAWGAVMAILLFPSSFFLGAVYNESLFLVFTLTAFIAIKKRIIWLAALAAGLAAATRVVGIFIIPALWLQLLVGDYPRLIDFSFKNLRKSLPNHFTSVLLLAVSLIGLAGYMWFLWLEFKDPLYFFHVQSEFGAGRQESIVLLPQVMWRYVKILATVPVGLPWSTYLQEFIAGTVPLLFILVAWLKRRSLPLSWVFFSTAALVLPTLTGTFSSMPRYVLAAFPLFFLLAELFKAYPFLKYIYYLSGILLLFNTILFIQGYWIA